MPRLLQIPEDFFKLIAEKGKLYSRVWFYWLSKDVDLLLEPEFIEQQQREFSKVSEIREIYDYGISLLRQDFKIIDKKNKKEKIEKSNPIAEKIIQYLNQQAGSKFQCTGTNLSYINARLKEGFILEDFITVIDNKIYDWKGTEREMYIRPITLFSKEKFENYKNQLNARDTANRRQQDAVAAAKRFFGIDKK